jgi:uncharacterized membrane protein YbhN (UPF0104 family)
MFLLAAVAVPAVILITAAKRGGRIPERVMAFAPRAVGEPLVHLLRTFADALHRVWRLSSLAMVAGLTLCCWATNVLVTAFLLRSFGFSQLGIAEAALVVGVTALCLLVPAPAAGIGVFELGVVTGLSMCGIDKTHSAAVALALHCIHVAVVAIAGTAVLAGGRLHLRTVWQAGRAYGPVVP